MGKDFKKKVAKAISNEERVVSDVITAWCRSVNKLLPLPRAEVVDLLRRFDLPATVLATPRRVRRVVVIRGDGDNNIVWVGPA